MPGSGTRLKPARRGGRSARERATTTPPRIRTRAMPRARRGQTTAAPCLDSRRAPRRSPPSGDVSARRCLAKAPRTCPKLPFSVPPTEVYSLGKGAAIVIPPPDPGRMPNEGEYGTAEAARTTLSQLLGEGWRVITTSRTANATRRQIDSSLLFRGLRFGRPAPRTLTQPWSAGRCAR